MNDPLYTNALIHESSPYLLQHAHNPVSWYPWGKESLALAARENKLVIVSIGYSSCHWCHVMERESFEDSEVAVYMNDHFISVKVDREERPDIDHMYMTAIHMMNQQGGWPLNCIALPDGRPIWGTTYLPKDRWLLALSQVRSYFRDKPDQTYRYATDLAEGIRQSSLFAPEEEVAVLDPTNIGKLVSGWFTRLDREHGGSQGAPKFPMPVNLEFLLHYGIQYKDPDILGYVKLTLEKMARGGIFDQAGGGFARYSVDPVWKVPHFEKMLYDNAQLIGLYASAYQVFGFGEFAQVVSSSIGYIKREMTSPEGAFYSALDADSEGTEGKYYIWTPEELEEVLGEEFDLFADYYSINETGLWEHGNYILYRTDSPETFARERGMEPGTFLRQVDGWNHRLLDRRYNRTRPGLDDKSLTEWNSLMIRGLTRAYRAIGEPEYLSLAVQNAELLKERMLTDEGVLFRNYKEGKRSIEGFLSDYAFFIEACLDLFEVSMEEHWLQLAVHLTRVTRKRFFDPGSGMFNYSAAGSEILISNHVEVQDNVIPSSNAVMASNLFRLGHMLTESGYLDLSRDMVRFMASRIEKYPHGFARWGSLLLSQVNPFHEIVVTGPSAGSVLQDLGKDYLPNAMLIGSVSDSDLPLFRNRFDQDKTRIFVCIDNTCRLPVEDPADAKAIYHIR